MMMPLLRDWDFDALITHNRFTLANRNADAMLDFAQSQRRRRAQRGALRRRRARQGLEPIIRATSIRRASDAALDPIRRIEAICARHGVPPGAAALQFSMRDPRIASTICGVSKPERVQEDLRMGELPHPRGDVGRVDGAAGVDRRSRGDARLQAGLRIPGCRRVRAAAPPHLDHLEARRLDRRCLASLPMSSDAEHIIGLYQRKAREWARDRGLSSSLFEKPWLDRFRSLLPSGGSILDIGCGSGEPIARYFVEERYGVTGINSSQPLIDLCKARFPLAKLGRRGYARAFLGRRFDGVLAWDSFFHLCPDAQRQMFSHLPQARRIEGGAHVYKRSRLWRSLLAAMRASRCTMRA